MDQQLEAQPESNEGACQEVSPAAYPQLCGSWPGDEWPEDAPENWHSDLANFCLSAEYAREAWA